MEQMMKMIKTLGLTFVGMVLTLGLLACSNGSDGAPGPAGSAGPAGADGQTGPSGPAGPGVTWVNVSGAAQQAAPNSGYLADSASEVVITLPASASLAVGDVVEVSGIGAGGWRIAQNAGQSIITKRMFEPSGPPWTAHEISRNWYGIASSSDGTRLVAVVNGGQIYTSTDSGATWTARESNRGWRGVASSSDGSKLVAAVQGGQIYTSTDSGVSWTARDSARSWITVASLADGKRLVA